MGRGPKPTKGKASPAVPGKLRANEEARVPDLEKRLAEALRDKAEAQEQLQTRDRELAEAREQRTATSEILRVISASPSDTQPVFDTILANAVRLCDAKVGQLLFRDGEDLRWAASYGATVAIDELLRGTVYKAPASALRPRGPWRPLQIRDLRETEPYRQGWPTWREQVDVEGARTVVAVPLVKGDRYLGSVCVYRVERQAFTERQIELLKTFADQAVIAIENVRLFTELQASNRDLTEALEQQTATAEILGVIASSPTDVQPVFDTIVRSAVRLCGGLHGVVDRFDGERIHLAAQYNYTPEALQMTQRMYPRQPDLKQAAGRAILTADVVNIADAQADPEYATDLAVAGGWRSILNVPMLREGKPIGTIGVIRGQAGRFSDAQVELLKTFADQAVIAIENVRLFTELQEKNGALTDAHAEVTEALDRQTATADILRVISQAQVDVQPVFEAIADSAMRLFGAWSTTVSRYEDGLIRLASARGGLPWSSEASMEQFQTPCPPTGDFPSDRVVLSRAIQHVTDVDADPSWNLPLRQLAKVRGYRSIVSVPMLRGDDVIGIISVSRIRVGGFTPLEIALLQTFADQAVIAVENTRLLSELQEKNRALTEAHAQVSESLEQQTATSEILSVISSSPTDVQPVFDAIVQSALRLLAGVGANVARVVGDELHLAAFTATGEAGDSAISATYPMPIGGWNVAARAVRARAPIYLIDTETDPDYQTMGKAVTQARGVRSIVAVPMISQGSVVGTIAVSRREPGSFLDKEIALLQTFADQAVIAIENVRLFTELQTSNRELTTALDTQTATSDILRVISRSQTDVQPVFDAIVISARRLLRGDFGVLTRVIGDRIDNVANIFAGGAEHPAVRFTWPLDGDNGHAEAIRQRGPVNIADAQTHTDPRLPEAEHARARLRGYQSVALVPLLRHDTAVGAISMTRREPGGFTPDEIALLQTFADQAVIAIENARLLSELQARTAELTRSVDELMALGEVGRALSSTLDLETVLNTIVARASQLAGTDACSVYEYDEATGEFYWRATANLDEEVESVARRTPIPRGVGAQGRMAVTRAPVQIPDIAAEDAYQGPLRDVLLRTGTRAVLAVPLLQGDRLVGGLTVNRKTPGGFSFETVELLKTFATQSALAINNARLFREIEEKRRQLEVASRHKSEFLANMSHELRTPLNAVIGFSEVLNERMFGDLNEKQDEYLKDIHASGQHLLSLINDILDLSKIEAGRMELELIDFHLPTAIENALMLVRERAGRRSIALHTNI